VEVTQAGTKRPQGRPPPRYEGKMKKLTLLLMMSLVTTTGPANEIAFTFDDAPRGDGHIYTGKERTQKIIDELAKENIQAAFFVNPERFNRYGGLARIKAYANAGHLIANHTHSHPSIKKTSLKAYIEDIDRADKLIQQFSTYTKWFRYPFLHEGDSIEVRDGVRNFLAKAGYKNGYVTVDNYDYFIDDLVQQALEKNEKVNLDKACDMLVDLLWDGLQFYDSVANKYIGNVRHVLLMHENDIEALCLSKLVRHLRAKDWKVVSPTLAFSDPLLKDEPDTLYLNQGRVAAIAHVRSGKKYVSKWESTAALTTEFERRRIATKN